MKKVLLFLALVFFSLSLVIGQTVMINEVDADTPGADEAEFIELYDGGVGSTSLDGYVVVLFNGSDDESYRAIDLDGYSTDANGYFVIGSTGMGTPIELSASWLQNGADAIALYNANASDFPNGTAVTTNNLIDAIVYDSDDADDTGLLVLLNLGEPQVNEAGAGDAPNHSMQRSPNGHGSLRNTSTYACLLPTPGATALLTGTIDLTAPNSGSYQNGDIIHITWTSSDVDSVLLYARMEELAEPFLLTEGSAILASVGAFDLPIPDDASEGNYRFIIKDKDNLSVADSSDNFIFVQDVVFVGLDDEHPFEPENGATDIPIDLFKGKLEMRFGERVQTGTGNINLKKIGDDRLAKAFDVTDPAQVSIDLDDENTVYMYLSAPLDPNTGYYIEVDAGAIVDRAGTPNEFDGFTGNSTWSFTTGAFDSTTPISAIQQNCDGDGNSNYVGEEHKVKGIVMYKVFDGAIYYGYYLQEGAEDWMGIFISSEDPGVVSVGDSVSLIGEVHENNYNTVIVEDVAYTNILATGKDLYPPVIISPNQFTESYESVWVRVENVECTDADLGDGIWEISDNVSNTAKVGSWYYTYSPTLLEEFTYIDGILGDLGVGGTNFAIEPTEPADVVSIPTRVKDVGNLDLVVGPNPVFNEIRITANTPIADVQILNLVGEVLDVETVGVAKRVNIAIDGLANGLYIVKVTFTDGTVKTHKIIKR